MGAALIAVVLFILWRKMRSQPTGRYDDPILQSNAPGQGQGHGVLGTEKMKLYVSDELQGHNPRDLHVN